MFTDIHYCHTLHQHLICSKIMVLVSATSAVCNKNEAAVSSYFLVSIRFLHDMLLPFHPGNVPAGRISIFSAPICHKQIQQFRYGLLVFFSKPKLTWLLDDSQVSVRECSFTFIVHAHTHTHTQNT